MDLSKAQIKNIASSLDMGMICYIHKETKEVTDVIDRDNPWVDDLEGWEDIFAKIDNHPDRYIKMEKISSNESFQIMEDFVEVVTDSSIKNQLITALNKRKPFKNFREQVDQNEEVRQAWFKFKTYKSEEWVKNWLESYMRDDLEDQEADISSIGGFFNDDGERLNPDLHPLPNLCLSCKKKDNPNEEILCSLTRLDQVGEKEFICHAYEQLKRDS